MHVSNSAVCAALVASLLVASASAAAPAGQISTYACDNECKSCRKTAVAKAVLTAKNSAGTANMAFCNPGIDRKQEQTFAEAKAGTALTAWASFNDPDNDGVRKSTNDDTMINQGEATSWLECAADSVAIDSVTIAVFREKTTDCTLDRHHKSYFVGLCYASTAWYTSLTNDQTAIPLSFIVKSATSSSVTFETYTNANCATATATASQPAAVTTTCNAVTETTDATKDANLKQILFVSKQTKTGVIRKITSNYKADASGTGAPYRTGQVPKTIVNAALGCDEMIAPVAYDIATNVVKSATQTETQLIAQNTDAGKTKVVVGSYEPRGVCVGDRNKKYIQVCPSGTVPSYTEAPTNPTTAPPNTTNATSSASAVSAVAAAFVAVACLFA